MKKIKVGGKYVIHCYKHDGKIHKIWEEAILLEIGEEYLVFGNNHTKVIEADGRSWKTREPAVMFFFKKKWFNVIGQCKKDGIQFYCNIASPFLIDDNAIKYIDYDLDLRVFPDESFKVLDRGEYNYHKKQMKYSKDLDKILRTELTSLIEMVRKKEWPFNHNEVNKYYEVYKRETEKITLTNE